jgi:hypothetical protein
VPAEHWPLQEVAPVAVSKRPAGQLMHPTDPALSWNFPRSQFVHAEVLTVVEYLPASQAEQEAAAASEYDPAGQLAHAVLDPTSPENFPESQLVQVAMPASVE